MTGVLGPIVGIIGTIQALEVLKVLLDLGKDLSGRLLLLDGLAMEWSEVRIKRDPACPVCSHRPWPQEPTGEAPHNPTAR